MQPPCLFLLDFPWCVASNLTRILNTQKGIPQTANGKLQTAVCSPWETSILRCLIPFYKLQEGLAPCMLRGTFLEHYFCQYVILQLCSNYVTKCPCSIPSLLHIHCIQCTYINLIVTVMVIQVDNDWSFVDPFFAYFFEWTRLLSARNDRTFLV